MTRIVHFRLLAFAGLLAAHGFDSSLAAQPATTFIVRAYADKDETGARENRCCATGALHVIYSDGKEFRENLHEDRADSDRQVEFSDIKISPDRQSVGWTEGYYSTASYPYPFYFDLFTRGHVVLRSDDDGTGMVWHWKFIGGGEQAAVMRGYPHGASCANYLLYDIREGRRVAEIFGNQDDPCLPTDAPAWAKSLDDEWQRPDPSLH